MQSMGQASTHTSSEVHKSPQTLPLILHKCPYQNLRFPQITNPLLQQESLKTPGSFPHRPISAYRQKQPMTATSQHCSQNRTCSCESLQTGRNIGSADATQENGIWISTCFFKNFKNYINKNINSNKEQHDKHSKQRQITITRASATLTQLLQDTIP